LEFFMVRLARVETLDPSEVNVAHVFTRVVRRCFPFGFDPASGVTEPEERRVKEPDNFDPLRISRTKQRFHLRRRVRELMRSVQ
jgi:hypothetical protein